MLSENHHHVSAEVAIDLCRQLGTELLSRNWKLATAESCTGGWISQLVTAVDGSSDWFDCGFVTYSNEAKQALLKVPAEYFDSPQGPGAVSSETVEAMAKGALAGSRAALSIATSGIAGPAGGTLEKPVGTVWIGWAIKGGEACSRLYQFDGDRESVRLQTVVASVQGALKFLSETG